MKPSSPSTGLRESLRGLGCVVLLRWCCIAHGVLPFMLVDGVCGCCATASSQAQAARRLELPSERCSFGVQLIKRHAVALQSMQNGHADIIAAGQQALAPRSNAEVQGTK